MWKCQQGKHEDMVRTVYNLIQEVLPGLSSQLIELFYNKIQQVSGQSCDPMYLNFLKEFTKVALDKRYLYLKNEHAKQAELAFEGQIDFEEDYETVLTKSENK